ncbi:hypothetical protein ASPZODRAFT_2114015 [Penicilliopsis zonata CBS 506.65]|uniref:FAD-binding domain-containing protein n=1 Tax=Penicilliopsis zonata CBS 506.65 TaxID=1073090 RepID=A0A1L9S8P4_9EURO|nr:hypothetical protein ASPZODRAFT_2114015 [Penicilliopsis zonata CBS 506.65]OJJ43532.1 hypothetical protein ASPZODRAFT_2114015 [Penicilliopsis zonata CBS 506.65]
MYSVIIAGGGPVGLFLAGELALQKISVLVLERDPPAVKGGQKTSMKDGPLGRRGLFKPAIEAFYRRGILSEILFPTSSSGKERANYIEKGAGFTFGGHFAGFPVNANQVDFSVFPHHRAGPSFMPGVTTLGRMEAVLAARAEALGVTILRGKTVCEVSCEEDRVRVYTHDQDKGKEAYTASYLVGCDGGRSTVRKACGFDFQGTPGEITGYAGICEVNDPTGAMKEGFMRTEKGMYIFNKGQGMLHLVDFEPFNRTANTVITLAHFESVLHRVVGTKTLTLKSLHQATSFTDRAMQATQYRRGNVFLAGDSAHIHSPLGAQGLTLGIADAINLGWKLARAVTSPSTTDSLLDTYHAERAPEAAAVLEWTRAQVVTLRSDPYSRAVGRLIQDLISTDQGATYFLSRMWGINQRYDLGHGNADSLVGQSAPDVILKSGGRLGDVLCTGESVVVADTAVEIPGIKCYQADIHGMMLVRPDGIVAYAGGDLDTLRSLLIL